MANGEGVSVTVYGQPNCGDCWAVKSIFDQKSIKYEYVEGELAEETVTKVCDALKRPQPAFPVITVNIKTKLINTQFAAVEPKGLALTAFATMLQLLQPLNKIRQNLK